MKRALLLGATVALAGCGGGARLTQQAKPPPLPRPLAHAWASQADAIASALAAGDGCTAQSAANSLQADVTRAIGAGEVPVRYRAALTAALADLSGRITCNPPPPAHDHGKGKDHGKHKGDKGDQG